MLQHKGELHTCKTGWLRHPAKFNSVKLGNPPSSHASQTIPVPPLMLLQLLKDKCCSAVSLQGQVNLSQTQQVKGSCVCVNEQWRHQRMIVTAMQPDGIHTGKAGCSCSLLKLPANAEGGPASLRTCLDDRYVGG